MQFDLSQMTPTERYFAMTQVVVPRPIAWVLSDNGEPGSYNLAPYSFFTAICSDPPILMISGGKKTTGDEVGREKDTVVNIRERERFVVHIANTGSLDVLNASAATLNHGDSEVTALGLETTEFKDFSLPRLNQCPVALGCKLHRIDEIGNAPQMVIFGEIEMMYVADDTIKTLEPRLEIDSHKLDPLARLGGANYAGLGEALQAKRPK